jgi:hypothetical protein
VSAAPHPPQVAGILPSATLNGNGKPRHDKRPSLVDELDVSRTRQDQPNDPRDHTRCSDIPLVFRGHVGEATWVLAQVLGSWAIHLGRNPRGMSPTGLASWFLDHLDLVQRTPDASTLVEEVTDAVQQARRAIDRPEDQRSYLGECGNHGCTVKLYSVSWMDTVTCEGCGITYWVRDRKKWLQEQAEKYRGTAPQIAGFIRLTGVKCSAEQVRGFAFRERITAVSVTERGHPQYIIGDVLDALRDRYVRRHKSTPMEVSPGEEEVVREVT